MRMSDWSSDVCSSDLSVDYNSVKALAQGQVDTFLGFKFVRTERVPKVGTSRMCVAWANGCIAAGTGMDVVTSIDKLPTQNMNVQVYARDSIGAVCVDAEGSVDIACLESFEYREGG